MNYKFYERNENAESRLLAEANVENGEVTWIKGKDSALAILGDLYNFRFDGYFDINNKDHWNNLPDVLFGSRMWVDVI